jgi:N6-adenosine-specific RNA methylase IME4
MTIEDIAALPIGNIADSNGAHLYLWTTDKQLLEGSALSVIISWGFVPYRTLIWRKASPALGSAWRSTHDACVVGRRGDLRFAPLGLPTVFDWKHPRANNKIHSAKPDGFLDMVEQVSPGPYVELFARRARFGWDYWGDQSLGTAEMAVAPSRGRSDA